MTIRTFEGKTPVIDESAYVDDSAVVIGDVTVAADASLWPMVVARGDVHSIHIGEKTNIQDGSILHVTHDGRFSPGGFPCRVGSYVTVGHRVTVHACIVGDFCLLGMSASSLVPTGKKLEGGYLYVGSPVKQVRPLKEKELEFLDYSAAHYAKLKDRHKTGD